MDDPSGLEDGSGQGEKPVVLLCESRTWMTKEGESSSVR